MLDPFCIVKPVKGENYLQIAKSFTKCLRFLLYSVGLYIIANLSVVNAHRECVHLRSSLPVDEYLAEVVFDSENAKYASEKMLCVVDCVESDQVSSKDAFQYGSAPSCW